MESPEYIYLVETDNDIDKIKNNTINYFFRNKLSSNKIEVVSKQSTIYKIEGENFINKIYKKYLLKNIVYVNLDDYIKFDNDIKINRLIYLCENLGVKELKITKKNHNSSFLNFSQKLTVNNIGEELKLNINDTKYDNNIIHKKYKIRHLDHIFLNYDEFITNLLDDDTSYFFNKDTISDELLTLIYSRIENNLNNFNLTIKTNKLNQIDMKISAIFGSSFSTRVSKTTEIKMKHIFEIDFYELDKFINSNNLKITNKCFTAIIQSNNMNLLDNFLEKYIIESLEEEHFRYKLLKIIDINLFNSIIKNIKNYDNLCIRTGSFFENLGGLSLSNLISFDDDGLKTLQNVWTFTYKHKHLALIDHCKNIRCSYYKCFCNYNKTICHYIVRVYNLNNEKLLTLDTNMENIDLYNSFIYIIYNINHMPTFDKFSKLVTEQLTQYTI